MMFDVSMLHVMCLPKVDVASRLICFAGVIAGATAWLASINDFLVSSLEMLVTEEGIGIHCDAFRSGLLPLDVASANIESVTGPDRRATGEERNASFAANSVS